MQFTIMLNQPFMLEHSLSHSQGILFSFLYSASSWAGQYEIDGHIYSWLSYQKIINELPILGDKPDTIKRLMLTIEKKGLIKRATFNNNSVFRITEIGQEWDAQGREKNPQEAGEKYTTVGKKIPDGREKNPAQGREKNPDSREKNPDSREKNPQEAGKKSTEVGKKIPEGREKNPPNHITNNQNTNYQITNNQNTNTQNPLREFSPVLVSQNSETDFVENQKTEPAEKPTTEKPKKQKTTFGADDLTKTYGVDAQVAADWLAVRQAKKLPLTATALKNIEQEAAKANITVAAAVEFACIAGWAGFKSQWYIDRQAQNTVNAALASARATSHGESQDQRLARLAAQHNAQAAAGQSTWGIPSTEKDITERATVEPVAEYQFQPYLPHQGN